MRQEYHTAINWLDSQQLGELLITYADEDELRAFVRDLAIEGKIPARVLDQLVYKTKR